MQDLKKIFQKSHYYTQKFATKIKKKLEETKGNQVTTNLQRSKVNGPIL